MVKYGSDTNWNNPDFREGKSTESKCNKNVVDHITPNFSRISHPYNDNIRVQIVRNYINLLHRRIGGIKSSIHSEQLEDKIAKLKCRNEPLNHQNPSELYSSAEPVCQNLSVRFVLATSTLWALLYGNWMQVRYNQKGTYKAGVSYILAYQEYNNSWSSFNTIPTPIPPHFRPEPGFGS